MVRWSVVLVLSAVAPVLVLLGAFRDDGPPIWFMTLAAGTVAGLAALGRHLVRARRHQASQSASLSVVRAAAVQLGVARDLAEIRGVALTTSAVLVGEGLHHVAWLVANGRSAVSPLEILGPDGPMRREQVNLDGVLGRLHGLGGGLARTRDDVGHSMVVVPVPARTGAPSALAVTTDRRLSDDSLESLTILASQTALASDSLLQSQELQHKRGEARFQQLIRHSRDAVFIVDWDGRVRYQSPSVVQVLGYLAVDLDGVLIRRIVHPDSAPQVESLIEGLVRSPAETSRSIDAELARADESLIHAEIVGLNLLDNPDVRGIVLTVRDVSNRRVLENQLRHQAFHDALTGLANRALFSDRVEHALNRVRRDSVHSPVVALVDLDDFKLVNDSLGHQAGDDLLCVVADRLRSCLRTGDTAARLGGDEFAVLLEDTVDSAAAIEVAERILDSLSDPVVVAGKEVYVRASVGVALRSTVDTTVDELMRNADLAMYAAKANGKACVQLYEPGMHLRVVDRLALRTDLARAIERHEIKLVYQPVVRLIDGEVVGFEALSRWQHPTRGAVSPAEFIPAAEDSGSILELGRYVLTEAARQLSAWSAAQPEASWRMSVNISATQLLDPDLLDLVQEVLDATGLDASQLVLELTESVLASDSERVLRQLHLLKELGVRIAIDDFGSGYSSLHNLQRVPFDVVKIAPEFVAALRQDDPTTTLARTIMDLARTLGREAIAEGVEDRAEYDGLIQLGCEMAQGYFLAEPATAAALEAQLGLESAPA